MNPAEYLLKFFSITKDTKSEEIESFDVSIEAAFNAMIQVQRGLEVLQAMNVQRLDTVKSVLPGIWEKVWQSFGDTTSDGGLRYFQKTRKSNRQLSDAEKLALESLAEKLPENSPLKDAEKTTIQELLQAVREALQEDETISEQTKMYVFRLVVDIELSLEDDKLSAFDLRNAIMRLMGVLSILEEQTGNATAWEKVRRILKQVGADVRSVVLEIAAGVITFKLTQG